MVTPTARQLLGGSDAVLERLEATMAVNSGVFKAGERKGDIKCTKLQCSAVYEAAGARRPHASPGWTFCPKCGGLNSAGMP